MLPVCNIRFAYLSLQSN